MQAQPNRTFIAEILATGEEIRTGTPVDSNSTRIAEQMEEACKT
jgi:molybdopterin-biosynthesis enzyme MoeA-like protein